MRVRLTRIDNLDLNLFEFDYDLTFMVFFLNAEDRVYARYGGRDAAGADKRQSLEGLRYTMQSVLRMHHREVKAFAPRSHEAQRFIQQTAGSRGFGTGCLHCHQVKEALISDLRESRNWTRGSIWSYPLPENLGLELEVDRGNVIKAVKDRSPAAVAGLEAGDIIDRLNNVPIHSLADTQFALDSAPKTGSIEVAWRRGDEPQNGILPLPDGWRKTDITWRRSLRHLLPSARLYGTDLTPDQKEALGLSTKQLAFRQNDAVRPQAKAAGIRGGDIIVGIDDKLLEMDVDEFLRYVRRNYVEGDQVTINILRDGESQRLTMTLLP